MGRRSLFHKLLDPLSLYKPIRQLGREIRKPFRNQEKQEDAEAQVEADNQVAEARKQADDQAEIAKSQQAILNANLQAEQASAKLVQDASKQTEIKLGDEVDADQTPFRFYDGVGSDDQAQRLRRNRNWVRL